MRERGDDYIARTKVARANTLLAHPATPGASDRINGATFDMGLCPHDSTTSQIPHERLCKSSKISILARGGRHATTNTRLKFKSGPNSCAARLRDESRIIEGGFARYGGRHRPQAPPPAELLSRQFVARCRGDEGAKLAAPSACGPRRRGPDALSLTGTGLRWAIKHRRPQLRDVARLGPAPSRAAGRASLDSIDVLV